MLFGGAGFDWVVLDWVGLSHDRRIGGQVT